MIAKTLEGEIQKATGIVFRSIPPDGKSRKFMVGRKEWFAISLGDCGAFGCFASLELYGWSGSRAWPISSFQAVEKLSRSQMKIEREIVAFGNACQDSGNKMSETDLDRYILSLKRVIEAGQGGASNGGR